MLDEYGTGANSASNGKRPVLAAVAELGSSGLHLNSLFSKQTSHCSTFACRSCCDASQFVAYKLTLALRFCALLLYGPVFDGRVSSCLNGSYLSFFCF